MSTTKVINHLSVDNLNLNEVLSQQDKFFVNDDLILIFNGSVMSWINRATIQEAKLLLKTNGMMAYEVANRMNFPSASAFSKFFKRETGLTPRAYQETTYK